MDDNMKFISNLIPLEDALAKIDENQKLMDTEKIHLKDSQGRVLMDFISAILRPSTGDFSNTYLFSQIHSLSFALAFFTFSISK